jgi:hypothetical protein
MKRAKRLMLATGHGSKPVMKGVDDQSKDVILFEFFSHHIFVHGGFLSLAQLKILFSRESQDIDCAPMRLEPWKVLSPEPLISG